MNSRQKIGIAVLVVVIFSALLLTITLSPSKLQVEEVNYTTEDTTEFANLSQEQRVVFRKALSGDNNTASIPGYVNASVWQGESVTKYSGDYYLTKVQ